MANFRANGSAVADKNADRQTDTHTNIEKYNIRLAVKPVKNGDYPLKTFYYA